MAACILFSFPTVAPGAAAHLDLSIPMKSIFLKPLPDIELFILFSFERYFNIKTKLTITVTMSYQFQTLIPRIDPEFYCGSRGMVLKYL